METSKELTGKTLFDQTSYVAATPANHSAPQANDKAKTTPDIFGRGCVTPLAHYDLATQSWKMYGDTSLWGEQQSLETLPKSGMTRNGVLYQQPAWEPITDEIESSSWPTPTLDDSKNVNPKLNRFRGLAAAVNEQPPWPTPTYGKLAGGSGGMAQIEAQYSAGNINAEERKAMRAGNGGKLNPEWVEWLMGFPTGWTDLED
jgi:hypothetical protein